MTYQGCATTFSTWDTHAVTCAIERAVANFEILAKQAEAGAIEWQRRRIVCRSIPQDRNFQQASACYQATCAVHGDAVMDKALNRLVFGGASPVRRQS